MGKREAGGRGGRAEGGRYGARTPPGAAAPGSAGGRARGQQRAAPGSAAGRGRGRRGRGAHACAPASWHASTRLRRWARTRATAGSAIQLQPHSLHCRSNATQTLSLPRPLQQPAQRQQRWRWLQTLEERCAPPAPPSTAPALRWRPPRALLSPLLPPPPPLPPLPPAPAAPLWLGVPPRLAWRAPLWAPPAPAPAALQAQQLQPLRQWPAKCERQRSGAAQLCGGCGCCACGCCGCGCCACGCCGGCCCRCGSGASLTLSSQDSRYSEV
jgi:hypothetical protein